MAYTKGGYAAKKSFTREYDARDRAMARMNGVTGASSLVSALVEAGIIKTQEEAEVAFNRLVGEITDGTLEIANSGPSLAEATATITQAFGSDQQDNSDPGAFLLPFGGYKGKTLREVYNSGEKGESYVTEFLAEKTNSADVKAAAQAFVATLG